MAALIRHRTVWTGFVGGPGVTTLYWSDAAGPNLTAWNLFLDTIKSRFPTVVTWQSQSSGDRLDDSTGAIIGSWSGSVQAPITGTSGGAYSAPSGAVVNWRTAGIVGGKRVRGRSFLVPLSGAQYDSDGTIVAAALTAMRTALTTFIGSAAADLRVWHRPVGGSGGSQHVVTNADIPDKSCVLRSRRD